MVIRLFDALKFSSDRTLKAWFFMVSRLGHKERFKKQIIKIGRVETELWPFFFWACNGTMRAQFTHICLCFRCFFNILWNPYMYEIFVLWIEIHSFVELIKDYNMHCLGLNFEWGRILKMAVWLGSTLQIWKSHK